MGANVWHHLCRRFKKTDVVFPRNAFTPFLAHLKSIIRVCIVKTDHMIYFTHCANMKKLGISDNLPPSCPPCLLCCPRSFSQRLRWRARLIGNRASQVSFSKLKLTYVPEPLGDIVKALCIGDVIHQHNTFQKRSINMTFKNLPA